MGAFFSGERQSVDLDEVQKRPTTKLRQTAAEGERTEINAEKAETVDKRIYFRLCPCVIARIEQHPNAMAERPTSFSHRIRRLVQRGCATTAGRRAHAEQDDQRGDHQKQAGGGKGAGHAIDREYRTATGRSY